MLAMLLLFLIVAGAVREIYSHAAVISYCGFVCACDLLSCSQCCCYFLLWLCVRFTPMLLLFLIVVVDVREIYSHARNAAVIFYCGCGCA